MALIKALMSISSQHTFEQAMGGKDITTDAMQNAIVDWFDLYFGKVDEGEDPGQRIPCVVVDGLYKAAFGEYKAEFANINGKTERLAKTMQMFDKIRATAFQFALIGGEGFIKPIPMPRKGIFHFSFINRMNFIVLAQDEAGNATSIGMWEQTQVDKVTYTLLEKRMVGEDGRLTISSKLFESVNPSVLGSEVPLETLGKYAEMLPEFTLPLPVDGLGLIPIKTPMVNCVDGSSSHVSVYAAAARKIRTCYRLEQRTEDEYELTQPHLIASADIQRRDKDGNVKSIPKYITPILEESAAGAGPTIYNPKPNQEQLEARANQNMRDIENIIGLRRGILSHVETDDKTAAAVYTSSARYAMTIIDFQGMWADTYQEAIRVCDLLGQMYLGWEASPIPEDAVTVSWGNGVLYDEAAEFERMYRLAFNGWLKPEYLIAWCEIHNIEQAKIEEIRKEFMPDMGELEEDEQKDEEAARRESLPHKK